MQMQIAEISVEIIRKKIKNMHLWVLAPDGQVRVSAPLKTPDAVIAGFVTAKLDWISKQQARLAAQPSRQVRKYVSGEPLYLWGKRYTLEVVHSRPGNSLLPEGSRAILNVRQASTPRQREAFVREWYREQLKAQVEKMLPAWEEITGLYCSGWQSKYMTTRWGTCNTVTRKIWLNLQLAKAPPACLEYVILHELAHLQVRDHGPRFEAILRAYMPDWKARKKMLNDSILTDMLPAK